MAIYFSVLRADRRIALVNAIALVGLLVSAPAVAQAEDRAAAKALHKQAKALRAKGDLDGALLKYAEAHDHFANLKVAQWIVARHLEAGRKMEAAAFLEKMISEKKPPKGVKWATGALAPLKAEVEAARAEAAAASAKAAEEAKAKAAADAEAKAAADAQAAAAAAAAAKADAARQAAELEGLKASATEEARARIQAEFDEREARRADARFIPMQLIMWGAGVGIVGLVGYSSFGVKAADKHTDAAVCFSDFLEKQSCGGEKWETLDGEADDMNGFADISLGAAILGLGTAVAGGVWLWRAGADDEPAAAAAPAPAGSGAGGDTWIENLVIAPGLGGASVAGTF